MLKKVISLALATVVASSLIVMPAHAATFSEENWAQYERGLYTSTSDFKECYKEYTKTSDGDEMLTAVKMVATTTKTLTSDRNPVAYKFGLNAADYGEHADDKATYAHMRFNLASYSDEYRNAMNKLQLRIDKQGDGASRNHHLFDTWAVDGVYGTAVYPESYTSSAAYTSKDWLIGHQGQAGNGPASSVTANSHETPLTAEDYDKIDLIMEYNKQGGATSYVFLNGKFMASYYDSGLTDKHFHGIVFRLLKSKNPKVRGNSDYIAMKFDADRIGHREYYNTDDYMVTMEDVLQDAGLGDTIDSTMIYKSKPGDLEWFMPGNEQVAYTFEKDYSERQRINANVTYSGTAATIEATNTDTENFATAAKMLSGFYPINGKTGVSYESYHPRAKYFKFSFDQTISNDAMWIEYATRYSGAVRAFQMWNNNGNLVVGIKGGDNVTCNGNGYKPTATMTGTNRIDWVLEPIDTEDENGCMKQYVYINGKLAGEGQFGNQHAVRLADIIISTKNAAGNITIDNWSMTVYNDEADIETINAEITGVEPTASVKWMEDECGIEYDEESGDFVVYAGATAKNYDADAEIVVAIYGESGRLLEVDVKDFESGVVIGNEVEPTIFNTNNYDEAIGNISVFVWDMDKVTSALERLDLEF